MWKFARLAALAACMVGAGSAVSAQDVRLADNAPQSYTVQKGDTLWGISGRFLKDPWRWPDVWRMNREQIRNPHLIYPGDVVRLDYVDGQPRLSLAGGSGGGLDTVRVSPAVRSTPLDREAIPSIPPGDLEPFLSKPLVTGPEGLRNYAEIVAGRDRERVIRGEGDRVYVVGMDAKSGDLWQIYRPVGPIRSLDLKQVLGYEYKHLGTARVERFAEVSTVIIDNALEEIMVGDRLIPAPRETIMNYVPHAPATDVVGAIIAAPQDSSEVGRGAIVTIDRGAADGVDVGTVLAIYRTVPPIPDPRPNNDAPWIVRYFDQTTWFKPDRVLQVPEERTGLLFVFRVFDRVSYALLVNSSDPVRVGDLVRKP
jgi:hypothetical protein